MKKHLFLSLFCILFGSSPIANAATDPVEQSKNPSQEIATSVSTDLMTMSRDAHCKQVLVTCLVNGVPMRMMLDTGATHTVLHNESVAKLKDVRWLDTSRMKFKSNSAQVPKILIADLQVGPGVSPQHPVIVVSLAAVRSMMAEKIDGIVGMDILNSLPFTFDLRKNECYWGIPGKGEIVSLRGERDPNGRLKMRVKSGEKTFALLLDTGSSVTRVPSSAWAPGAAGEITAQIGDVDTASRQQMTAGNPGQLEVAPGVLLKKIEPLLCESEELTMLGMDALEDNILIHLPSQDETFGTFYLMR